MWKSIVLAAALAGSPWAMAQTTAPNGTPPGSATSQLSDATIQQAGHALRDVAQIRTDYSQRIQTVQDPGQRQQLVQEAQGRQLQAIKAQGISVQQYNQVIQTAQANPAVKQRLLAAAGAQ
jgi:GTP1/Obg family GTP-binding protein